MDIISQRLIALGNRVVAQLRRIADSISQHEQAEQERSNTEQEQQSPAAMVGIRDAVQSIAQSQKTAHDTKKWYKDRTFLVSLAGVLVVGAYTFVTALQWRDANRNF